MKIQLYIYTNSFNKFFKPTPFHNLNFKNQVVLKELEDEPAYKRKGLELDEPEHSSAEPNSRVVLDANADDLEIKNNNSFLHDNVD